jgi:hypothetical protein
MRKNSEAHIEKSWTDEVESNSSKVIARLKRISIFSWLGGMPIADITAPVMREVLWRIEKRKYSQVMLYVIR